MEAFQHGRRSTYSLTLIRHVLQPAVCIFLSELWIPQTENPFRMTLCYHHLGIRRFLAAGDGYWTLTDKKMTLQPGDSIQYNAVAWGKMGKIQGPVNSWVYGQYASLLWSGSRTVRSGAPDHAPPDYLAPDVLSPGPSASGTLSTRTVQPLSIRPWTVYPLDR